MSNYFRTLERLEKALGEPDSTPEAVEPESPLRSTTEEAEELFRDAMPRRPAGLPGDSALSCYSELLDNMNALANGRPISTVVLCGVSGSENVEAVIGGITAQTAKRNLSVLRASLGRWQGEAGLRTFPAPAEEPTESDGETIPVALRGGPLGEAATAWLSDAARQHDLVVIDAPPLHLSMDAAILARACDGLILVVESNVTTQTALRAAVRRAQTAQCKILGLVVNGTHQVLPDWVRQIGYPGS